MPVKIVRRINHCIYYRFTTTTIINRCIRHKTTTASLPIPSKYNINDSVSVHNNHKTSTPKQQSSQSLAPWQQRSITLHDQCYKLPDLIIARIESISNAKIDTLSTITKQKISTHQGEEQEIVANTSFLSSFYPSQYYQISISGDGNAVDVAMQIYIYYSQNAIPITLDTKIPRVILDIMSKEYGCFIEKQNDFIYRIYPLTLDRKKDKENICKIQQQIRASIHKVTVPYPWYDSNDLMQILFSYLKSQSKRNNLPFKSGGYFWYDRSRRNVENNIMDNDHNEEYDGMDAILYHEQGLDDVGCIWTYQDAQNKQVIDIENELQVFIAQFIKDRHFISVSDKMRAMLNAKKNELWYYIKTVAKSEYNIDCVLGKDCVLYQRFGGGADKVFENMVCEILAHIEHIEINIHLTEERRKDLHKLCADFNLIYIIPDNEAFISYYYNSYFIGKQLKNKNELISRAIQSIIDPLYSPQENVRSDRVKSQQLIKIENSEKYHVVIRMLQYLNEKKGVIKDIKDVKNIKADIYYSILPKQRSVALTVEGVHQDGNNEFIEDKIANIYQYINDVNSVSVSLPILMLLKGNKNDFINTFEEKYNVIISTPPISGNVGHIIEKHKQQKRLFLSNDSDSNKNQQIMAKIYFWCKNEEKNDKNKKLIQEYFENIAYKHIDIPIPIDLLYRATTTDTNENKAKPKRVNNEIDACKYFEAEYDLIGVIKHYMDKNLKIFNPKPFNSRYWLYSERENKANLDRFKNEIETLLNQCPVIDLREMAPLIQFLKLLPELNKKHKMKSYLSMAASKLFCFDVNKFEAFRNELESETNKIKEHGNYISIGSNKYDIALFLVTANFERISKIIGSNGFLWINNFEQTLNIYCDNNNINLMTIEHDVIKNINENSMVLAWNQHFNLNFNQFEQNSHLQQQLKNIMKQTNTKYAIRRKRPITPTIAITNYDKYELQNVYKKLRKLLSTNENITEKEKIETPKTLKNDSLQNGRLPKPIVLS